MSYGHTIQRKTHTRIPLENTACVLRCLASAFRRVCAIMVHLTYNGAERRKMPSTLKIELFTRYHSETPCKVCPIQSAAYPETLKRPAPTVSRYHAGADRSSREPSPHIMHSMCGLVKPYAIQRRPEPEPTAEPCRPNQSGTITPNRSNLSRSARAGFFAALRSRDCAAGSMIPYCHARKCFLRVFCADFCELHQMLIRCNIKQQRKAPKTA